MKRSRGLVVGAAAVVLGIGSGVGPANANDRHDPQSGHRNDHVLLVSVDGLHASDLDWYVHNHPASALAALTHSGTTYTNAQTPVPSDSFPGLAAQVTGGNPRTTGVYYDDSWNRSLLPAGTTNCTGATPGTEVTYFEQLDKDPTRLDAGQGECSGRNLHRRRQD